jgi:ABC-type lipoprotein export system ATPase subunit
VLVAVTGVAGSGKSSLIHGCLPRTNPSVTVIDQSTIRGSRRSNPATYTGILDPIRTAFAKANGVKPALFSANSEGACPNCNGLGKTYTSLGFMAEVVSICEVCEGRRYTDDVLEYRLRGRNIVEALAMPVEEAREFFTEKPVKVMLERLADVGLGYISLGQELDTLSGGERQRLKLAIEMSTDTEVYVLDEPTTGLHMQDVDNLIGLLDRLVESGRTVIVIEHNLDVIAPRGLGHRPGSGRRARRRAGGLRGHAGGARRRRRLPHRVAPRPPARARRGRLRRPVPAAARATQRTGWSSKTRRSCATSTGSFRSVWSRRRTNVMPPGIDRAYGPSTSRKKWTRSAGFSSVARTSSFRPRFVSVARPAARRLRTQLTSPHGAQIQRRPPTSMIATPAVRGSPVFRPGMVMSAFGPTGTPAASIRCSTELNSETNRGALVGWSTLTVMLAPLCINGGHTDDPTDKANVTVT